MIRWSSRSDNAEGPRNEIAVAIERRRAASLPLIDLTLSNPTEAGLHYATGLFAHTADAISYQPDALGLRSARQTIAAHMHDLGVPADPDRMLLTASTSEAYGFLFKLLCDPGDEVLVPAPSYPLFDHLARLEAVTPVSYPLLPADDFRIDLGALRQRITERTRAIVIVSPNNPTGSMIKHEELQALGDLGLPVISDEVFGAFLFTPSALSARTALYVTDTLVFSLFGLSKLVGLPQMKLAWTCINGPDALVQQSLRRLELLADTYLSVATPVQLQVERLFSLGTNVRGQIRDRTRHNLTTLQTLARTCPAISVLTPEAGWCVVVRLPSTRSEEQWALGLIERSGVIVHPGYFYDFADEAYVVLSLLPPADVFMRGVTLLCEHVNEVLT